MFAGVLYAQGGDFDDGNQDDYFTESEPDDGDDLFGEDSQSSPGRPAGFGGLFFVPQAAPDAFTAPEAVELAPSVSFFGGERTILATYLRANYGYTDDLLFAGEFDYALASAPPREFFDEPACALEELLQDFSGVADARPPCRQAEAASRFSLGADWRLPLTDSQLQLSLGGRLVYSLRQYGDGPAFIPRLTATFFAGDLRIVPWLGFALGEEAGLEFGGQLLYPLAEEWDLLFEAAYLSGGGGSFGRYHDEAWAFAAPGFAWHFAKDVSLQVAVPLGFADAPEYGVSVRFSTVFGTGAP